MQTPSLVPEPGEQLDPKQIAWRDIHQDIAQDRFFKHLRKKGIKLVPGTGSLDPGSLFFVSTAPGEHENKLGIPFAGVAGALWEELLEDIGLSRDDVYITNVIKYMSSDTDGHDPSALELRRGFQYVKREIELVNPAVIVPLGRIPTRTFFPSAVARHLRGKPQLWEGKAVYPTYHPAAMVYQRQLKDEIREQFQQLRDFYDGK